MKNYLDSRTPAERKNDGKIKSITTSTPPQSDWEKEFDERFGDFVPVSGFAFPTQIKSFISTQLQKAKEEALTEKIKKIEGDLEGIETILQEQITRMEKRKSWQGCRVKSDLEEALRILSQVLSILKETANQRSEEE